MEFTEAESNMNDLVSEYQQYQDAVADEEGTSSCLCIPHPTTHPVMPVLVPACSRQCSVLFPLQLVA